MTNPEYQSGIYVVQGLGVHDGMHIEECVAEKGLRTKWYIIGSEVPAWEPDGEVIRRFDSEAALCDRLILFPIEDF